MPEKISVVVTCYNHEEYIAKCLKSIFEQTYPNIELLVFNDGSTDNSDIIIRKMLEKSPFAETYYFSAENQGVAKVRNEALDKITGAYLLFVDSDNFLNPDHIEILLSNLIEKKADIAYCQLWDFENKKNVLREDMDFSLEKELEGNLIDASSLVRRNIIAGAQFDVSLQNLEDYDFWLNIIINHQAKPIFVKETKLNYRLLENSRSGHDDMERYYQSYLNILGKYESTIHSEIAQAIKANILLWYKNYQTIQKFADERLQLVKDQEQVIQQQIQKIEDRDHIIIKRDQTIQELTSSKSYRLGAFQIKMVKRILKAVKHPDLAIKYPIYGLKKTLLSYARGHARQRNNYADPKRMLIYVIYGNKHKLQEYKLIFLRALVEISAQVLIVINGEITEEDFEKLSKYGKVEIRKNEGYDTAAFRHGILSLGKDKLTHYDELLLVNDTNVGPFSDLKSVFEKMSKKRLDFWGISYGEMQEDFTRHNPYGTIPMHLQSYFLVIEKSLFNYSGFYRYWEALKDTNSREKAIGKHETVFTKYFEDLGFKHGAVSAKNEDSPMYIHPLMMLRDGVPLVKYTAFANNTNDKFAWQGLERETEVPKLLEYIENQTSYPMESVAQIMSDIQATHHQEHILIIDGVENAIPQCTRYRVENKAEQLRSLGYNVWTANASNFQMGYAEHASAIIIYRAGYSSKFAELFRLAHKYDKFIYYDIDDLVIDTKYTDLLTYTQNISEQEKRSYDAGVHSYGQMLELCDGVITSTKVLKHELLNYKKKVLINRNLASKELIELSEKSIKNYNQSSDKVKIGYFSGSITHNENFDLIKTPLSQLLIKYPNLELHIVGHLNIPKDFQVFKKQLVTHDYVDWKKLPALISEIDINLAPLVDTVFNQSKSEIKWIEAALVKVPTIASNLGSFAEMIHDGETGELSQNTEWFEKLETLIIDKGKRQRIAENAYRYVLKNCITEKHEDTLTEDLRK